MSDPAAQTGFSLRSLARSAGILAGGTAAAQAVAILRELFVAANEGLSGSYDATLIALVIPMTLATLATSGLVTALVPAYVAIQRERGREQSSRLASVILTWVAVVTAAMWLLVIVAADPLVHLVGPGLSAASHDQAVSYLQLLAPVVMVIGVSGIVSAVCQAEERFGTMALAVFVGPAIGLVVMLWSWDRLGLEALVVANIVGPSVTLGLLLIGAIRASVTLRPRLMGPGLGTRALLRHAIPLTISASVLQLTVLADRAIASLIAPGAVSALRYAEVLVRLPIGAIGPAWGNAVYPALVRASHRVGGDTLGSVTMRLLRLTIIAFLPIAALTAAVAPVAVGVAYGRGAFTAEDLATTAQVVAAFAPLIVVLMVMPVIVDSLNARRRGTVLLVGGIVNTALNIILDVVFGLTIGVAGIALAMSCSIAIVMFFVLAPRLARSEPEFQLGRLARPSALATLAALPAAIVIGSLAWSGAAPREGIWAIAFLVAAGVAGLTVYGLLAIRLGLEEPIAFAHAVRERLGRRRGAGTGTMTQGPGT